MHREMLAMCSFPFCEGSAAVLMQPNFDRFRATWHDAQIRHTMGVRFIGTISTVVTTTGTTMVGGRHATMVYRTCQNTSLDPAAPEAGHASLCRVRVPEQCGA